MCPVAFVFAKGHYAPIAGQEEQVWNEMVIQFFNMSFQWPFRKKARTPPPLHQGVGEMSKPNMFVVYKHPL